MGSLFKTPTPSFSPVSFVPTSPNVGLSEPISAINKTDQSKTSAEGEDQVRQSIRRASRGRNTTIKTSFRGVLGDGNNLSPQRKTLLGE